MRSPWVFPGSCQGSRALVGVGGLGGCLGLAVCREVSWFLVSQIPHNPLTQVRGLEVSIGGAPHVRAEIRWRCGLFAHHWSVVCIGRAPYPGFRAGNRSPAGLGTPFWVCFSSESEYTDGHETSSLLSGLFLGQCTAVRALAGGRFGGAYTCAGGRDVSQQKTHVYIYTYSGQGADFGCRPVSVEVLEARPAMLSLSMCTVGHMVKKINYASYSKVNPCDGILLGVLRILLHILPLSLEHQNLLRAFWGYC